MRLFDCFSTAGFHTCIATTFSIDFEAYELIALPRLREAGCTNNVLVADSRMLALALADEDRRPTFAGRRYSVVGAQCSGVFHPKLVLQLGKNAGRLLVASANMTAAGMAGNLEVVGAVEVSASDMGCVPILQSALRYITGFLPEGSIARRQVDWSMQRTPWLQSEEADSQPVALPTGERLALLCTDSTRSIGERFQELVGERQVKRLVVVSPYWDPDLGTVKKLERVLQPQSVKLLVREESQLFPVDALGGTSADVHDVTCVPSAAGGRFPHAKLVIAESDEGDCVLFGSANCTNPALGLASALNEEACLFRELAPGKAVEALGLAPALAPQARLEPSDIRPFHAGEEIPIEQLGARLPGRFEMLGRTLRWWPSMTFAADASEVILLGPDEGNVVLKVAEATQSDGVVVFTLDSDTLPHFAWVRSTTVESSYAVVVVQGAIHQTQRKAANKAAAAALKLLEEDGAEEGLWWLEVIQRLHDAERPSTPTAVAPGSAAPRRSGGKDEEAQAVFLSYEEFVAGRAAQQASMGLGDSHLAPTLNESVRAFINAVLSGQRVADDEVEDAPVPSFGMGDDPDQKSTEPEGGEPTEGEVAPGRRRPPAIKNRAQRLSDTQKDISKAINGFLENLRERVASTPLQPLDLLRLRAILVVILGAGTSSSANAVVTDGAKRSSRQVLPSDGEFGWPSLVGRVLFEFFRAHPGARKPLIRSLVFEGAEGGGFPADILECWATCYWALCAARLAPSRRVPASSVPNEQALALDLYGFTGALAAPELEAEVARLFALMGRRYSDRLGVSAAGISREHEALVRG